MDTAFADGKASLYSRGDIVPVDNLAVDLLQQGYIGLYSNVDSIRRFLFVYKHGDLFSYAAPAGGTTDRPFLYIALSPVTVSTLTRPAFDRLLRDPDVSLPAIANLREISQLQMERIDNLQRGQTMERLLERLWFFARRVGIEESGRITFGVTMSHVDLASSIGASRETVTRYMKQLEAAGILTVRRQHITITSPALLQEAIRDKQLPPKLNWRGVPLATLQAGLALQGAITVYDGMGGSLI